jgi:Nucleotidyltransferase domain
VVIDDERFAQLIAERTAQIPGVLAVTLGGSRARGEHRPDSDWDFGLYYRGRLNPDDVRGLGWPGTVVRYPLTTLSLALRAVAQARHTGRRPPVRPSLLRLRVIASYLRLLPAMLLERRRLARRAVLGRGELQRWLVPH